MHADILARWRTDQLIFPELSNDGDGKAEEVTLFRWWYDHMLNKPEIRTDQLLLTLDKCVP
jgi:hypothetical protein